MSDSGVGRPTEGGQGADCERHVVGIPAAQMRLGELECHDKGGPGRAIPIRKGKGHPALGKEAVERRRAGLVDEIAVVGQVQDEVLRAAAEVFNRDLAADGGMGRVAAWPGLLIGERIRRELHAAEDEEAAGDQYRFASRSSSFAISVLVRSIMLVVMTPLATFTRCSISDMVLSTMP